jgi:soluble lytic murein transglycosylase
VDSAGQVTRRRAGIALASSVLIITATACGPSSHVAPPPTPAPPPVTAEALPTTLDEARALQRNGKIELYRRALRALAFSSDSTTSRRAQTLLALDLFDRKRFAESVPALEIAAVSNAAIAPYLKLRIIDADENLGRLTDAIATAAVIVEKAPASSAATIARLRLPALFAAAADETNMNAALQVVASIPIDALTESDFVGMASRLQKNGRAERAAEIRMRILRDYPQGRYIEEVYRDVASASPSPLDSMNTEDATRLASNLARVDRYDQALELLKRISGRADAAASALYRNVRLRALFNSRNYTQLLAETEEVELDAPLQLVRARAAWRDDKPQEFLAGLQRIEKKFPKSKEAIEAKVVRAKYYATDVIDYERSIDNLRAAIDAGAVGNDGENIWTLGFTYVLWGKYDEALQTFSRYIREYPDGDFRMNALFWTGKIYDRRGARAERDAALRQLIAEYPFNYYAYRAREILGEPELSAMAGAGAGDFPDVDVELAKIADSRLDAVRELIAVDLLRDATREMKMLAVAYPDNAGIAFLLADVYASGGEVFEAIGLVQRRFRPFIRHGGSHIPHRLWQILFPLNYWDAIRAEAQKRNLDPYLVASIIRQESGFEPTVVSNAGAVGLMQIMPAEAPRIASQAGLDGITREQLFDPMTNIAVGAAEYSQKLGEMHGNHLLAIAAYNAGEDAVGRWLALTPINGDPDIFVDSIPYAETRLYVKSVTRNRFEYRRVYESSTAVPQAIGRTSDPHQ